MDDKIVLSRLERIEVEQIEDLPRRVIFSEFSASPDTIKQWLAFLREIYPRSWVRYQEDKERGTRVLTLRLYEGRTTAGLRVACRLYNITGNAVEGF
ncbi:MAG: hypothetical protein ACK42D_04170 [Candidatus Paceibacteria bacterium]